MATFLACVMLGVAAGAARAEPLPEAALERGRRRAEMAELVSRQTSRGRAQTLVTEWFRTGGKPSENHCPTMKLVRKK